MTTRPMLRVRSRRSRRVLARTSNTVKRGGVVDVDRRFRQPRRGAHQAARLLVVEIPGPEPGVVHARLGAEHPQHELLLGHLEGEDGHADPMERGVDRDVERERGLAHARPAGDDEQVRGLETGGQLVEVVIARRHPGDHSLALGELRELLDGVGHQVADPDEGRVDALFRDVEDGALGVVPGRCRRRPALPARGTRYRWRCGSGAGGSPSPSRSARSGRCWRRWGPGSRAPRDRRSRPRLPALPWS